ncbi:MAG: hypothetical protein KAS32_26135 [Candidatus Peribacteraceae bacterium]|nr:hypothetical protein [Candidatus Peribacteraceae bacterium]
MDPLAIAHADVDRLSEIRDMHMEFSVEANEKTKMIISDIKTKVVSIYFRLTGEAAVEFKDINIAELNASIKRTIAERRRDSSRIIVLARMINKSNIILGVQHKRYKRNFEKVESLNDQIGKKLKAIRVLQEDYAERGVDSIFDLTLSD